MLKQATASQIAPVQPENIEAVVNRPALPLHQIVKRRPAITINGNDFAVQHSSVTFSSLAMQVARSVKRFIHFRGAK
ncbi:MAG: hypothetical protein ACTHLX_01845 [Candidatus Binatia bacterium]